MTRLAAWAILLAAAATAAGASPDPKMLTIPERDLVRARDLTARLGDTAFPVREQATRELFKMGRLALPAVEQTLATASDPEVKARCEWLLPKALAADNKARLDAFLADADGKFDHDLPGWTELAKVAGATRSARELFVEMVRHKPNADLLAALRQPDQLGPRLLARRTELYARMYGFNPDRTRTPPAPSEVAALVLAEVRNTAPLADRRFYYAPFNALHQPGVRDALARGEAFRKLVAHWLDSRTDPNEQYYAMNTAATLDIKEVSPTALALRVLAAANGNGPNPAANLTAYTKAQALGLVAKTGDKAHLPVVRTFFADDGKMQLGRFINGQNQVVEMKVADFALAMAVALTGQDPKAYGFDVQNTTGAAKYQFFNYTFGSDERRKAAFVKWGFWELRQKK